MLPLAFVAFALTLVSAEDAVLGRIPAGHELLPGTLRVAHDGSRVACVVRKGKKEYPLVGDELGAGWYDVWPPVMHKSGKHLAFRVTKATARVVTASVVYNGKIIETDEWIGPVALDPESGAPAFLVSSGWINNADGSLTHAPMALHYGKAKGKKWVISSTNLPPSFPSAGGRLVCVGTKGGATSIMSLDAKGGEERLEHDASYPIEAIVSPDGREIAYTYLANAERPAYSRDESVFGVRRERIGKRDSKNRPPDASAGYESAGGPVFSDDGKHLAFRARSGIKFGIVLDGASGVKLGFDYVDAIRINPKGDGVAYRAARGCKPEVEGGEAVLHGGTASGGKWLVVHGDERSEEYELVGEPVWSPDGLLCAYAVNTKKGWRVLAGKASSEAFDEVSPLVWSQDGRTVHFASVAGDTIRWSALAVE